VALTRALIQQTRSGLTVSGPEGSRSPAPVIEIPCLRGYVSTAIEIRYCSCLRQRNVIANHGKDARE
jgi:hypothetical protein